MDFQQIRKYVKGVLTNSFLNKTTLDKLSTSDAGNLLFDGKEINSGSSDSETSNSFYLIDYNSMESVNSRNFTVEKDCYIEVETYANDNKEEHYYIDWLWIVLGGYADNNNLALTVIDPRQGSEASGVLLFAKEKQNEYGALFGRKP